MKRNVIWRRYSMRGQEVGNKSHEPAAAASCWVIFRAAATLDGVMSWQEPLHQMIAAFDQLWKQDARRANTKNRQIPWSQHYYSSPTAQGRVGQIICCQWIIQSSYMGHVIKEDAMTGALWSSIGQIRVVLLTRRSFVIVVRCCVRGDMSAVFCNAMRDVSDVRFFVMDFEYFFKIFHDYYKCCVRWDICDVTPTCRRTICFIRDF